MKRRKDSGFTLIELMIVIAVIGILAIVLIPKVGQVKTQAKSAGIDTNMRSVEGYVQSKINGWANKGKDAGDIATDIKDAFDTEKIPNPFTSTVVTPGIGTNASDPANNALFILTDGNSDVTALGAAKTKGTISVSVTPADGSGTVTSITITPHNETGAVITDKVITITP